jgi:hypothetical protein
LSSIYSDGGIIEDIPEDLSDYETEEIPVKRTSPTKDISKPGTK